MGPSCPGGLIPTVLDIDPFHGHEIGSSGQARREARCRTIGRTVQREWAGQAHRLGWEVADLFGVHPTKPTVRMDCMGLVPLLKGRPLVVITDDSAAIKAASGGSLTFRKRAAPPTERCLVWERHGSP